MTLRSIMFVPAHREKFVAGLSTCVADAVILDLEDSVPPDEKTVARAGAARNIASIVALGKGVYVRVNRSAHLYDFDDILAVVKPGLDGIVLPMPNGPDDIVIAAALIAEAEVRNGVATGSVSILPAMETPRAIQLAYEIALHPRVRYLMGAFAKGADLARATGMEWTPEGTESLYMKSRIVLAARAAGKLPLGGVWQQVHDTAGMAAFCEAERRLGMVGTTILHPAGAPIANRAFGATPEQLEHYRALVAAYEEATAAGLGSVMFAGEHIDKAHAETARQALAAASQQERS